MYSSMVYNGIRLGLSSQCKTRKYSKVVGYSTKCPTTVIAVTIQGGLISHVENMSMNHKLKDIKKRLKKDSAIYGYSENDVDNIVLVHKHYDTVEQFAKTFKISGAALRPHIDLKKYEKDENLLAIKNKKKKENLKKDENLLAYKKNYTKAQQAEYSKWND